MNENGQDSVPAPTSDVVPEGDSLNATQWLQRIKAAGEYDKDFFARVAENRSLARGDSKTQAAGNPIGDAVEIAVAFIYARNPSVDVLPSVSTEPPPIDVLMEAAQIGMPEQVAARVQQMQMAAALTPGMPPVDPMAIQQLAMAEAQANVMAQFEQMRQRFKKRQSEQRAFADTMEIAIEYDWTVSNLKKRAKKAVRSNLTNGVGWLWKSWQERTARSPETARAINDQVARVAQVDATRKKLRDEGASTTETDAELVTLRQQLKALQDQPLPVVARGPVTEFVRTENIQIAPGVEYDDYLDAPWISRRIPMQARVASSVFGLTEAEASKAKRYHPRQPKMGELLPDQFEAKDAQFFSDGESSPHTSEPDGSKAVKDDDDWLMMHEVWNREAGTVGTLIEGVARWVREPEAPKCATTRFYPCFLYADTMLDGYRHPQSRVSRAAPSQRDYNLRAEREALHRDRSIPKTVFDRGNITDADAKKITDATTQELVGIKPLNPTVPLAQSVVPLSYAAFDPNIYERETPRNDIDRVFGIQEALSGAIETPKTATEAEIQDKGFNARSSSQRDTLEDMFTDMAKYTAELLWCHLSKEDIVEIAGPDAFWPPYGGPQALGSMLNIEIRAGSSGKPNSKAEREAWSALLPMFQGFIQVIGQLRGTPPADLANAYERLARMTADVSGMRVDIESLIPNTSAAIAAPGMPGALPGAPPPAGGPLPPGEAPLVEAPPPPALVA